MRTALALLLAACAWRPLNAKAAQQTRGDLISPQPATPVTKTPATKQPAALASANAAPVSGSKEEGLVSFDQLAGFAVNITPELDYTTNRTAWADAQINAMIPAAIKHYNGKTVSVEGYLMPLDFKDGKVTAFILTRGQPACCFGALPQLHELIYVRAKEAGAKSSLSCMPVRVRGVLHVGAQRVRGSLTGIYRMDADDVAAAP
jgi:hypothetical protein